MSAGNFKGVLQAARPFFICFDVAVDPLSAEIPGRLVDQAAVAAGEWVQESGLDPWGSARC